MKKTSSKFFLFAKGYRTIDGVGEGGKGHCISGDTAWSMELVSKSAISFKKSLGCYRSKAHHTAYLDYCCEA